MKLGILTALSLLVGALWGACAIARNRYDKASMWHSEEKAPYRRRLARRFDKGVSFFRILTVAFILAIVVYLLSNTSNVPKGWVTF